MLAAVSSSRFSKTALSNAVDDGHGLGHASRPLLPFDFDGDLIGEPNTAALHRVGREELAARPHLRAGRHRAGKSDSVAAVVDAVLDVIRSEERRVGEE